VQTVFVFFDLGFATLIGAPAVDKSSGGTFLHTHTAGNARTGTPGKVHVADQHAFAAAFVEPEGEVTHQFATGAYATPAQDAAVVVQDEYTDARHPW